MTRLTALAAVVGWLSTIVVLGQAGTVIALPALAGWSVSTVIGIDASRRHEQVPAVIAIVLTLGAVLFAGIALRYL
jgi:hypothetical protein